MPRRVRIQARRGEPERDVEVVEKPPAETDKAAESVEHAEPATAEAEEQQQEPQPQRRDTPMPDRILARLSGPHRELLPEALELIADAADRHAARCVERGELAPLDRGHAGVVLAVTRFARGTS